jgi:hypothetical protein
MLCERRCLCCGKRRLNNVYHNYVDCPKRANDIKEMYSLNSITLEPVTSTSIVVNLVGTSKCFVFPLGDPRFEILETVFTTRKVNGRKVTRLDINGAFDTAPKRAPRGKVRRSAVNTASQKQLGATTNTRGVTTVAADPRRFSYKS